MIMSVCLGIAGFTLAFWSMNAFLRYIAMYAIFFIHILAACSWSAQVLDGPNVRRKHRLHGLGERLRGASASEARGSIGLHELRRILWQCLWLVRISCLLLSVTSSFRVHRYEWPSEWGPTYRGSFILTSLTALIAIGMALAFRHHLTRLNDEAEKKELDDGDDTPGYRYML